MLLIGFLLVLTTTVFNLVLRELRDTRGLWDSVKAFAWAEAAQELALLKIKEKWYGIDHKIQHTINADSVILSENPSDRSLFKKNKDVFISYDLGVATNSYSGSLLSQWYSIIPLFVEELWYTVYTRSYNLIINSVEEDNLVWNLLSSSGGISWTWANIIWTRKEYNETTETSSVDRQEISNFLRNNDNSYLILFNSWNSDIEFTLTSAQSFSKPKTQIISSAQVGDYRHNLQTDYDNTKFLNMLKYSVFSN
jgi:hypothetical protein